MSPLRQRNWGIALVLAVGVHIAAMFVVFLPPGSPPVLLGGGLYDQGGESSHSSGTILVSLGEPGEVPVDRVNESEPLEETDITEPTDSFIEDLIEEFETEEIEERGEPEMVEEEEEAKEQSQGVPETELTSLPPTEEINASELPPKPTLRPKLQPAGPEIEPLERRLPAQGPAPTPENSADVSAVTFDNQPSRIGTASGNVSGVTPSLTYEQRVLLWLKRHGRYPREAFRFRQEGTVLLKFSINRRGQILNYRIAKSSGYYILDEAVRNMMFRSSPVPPMPPEVAQAKLDFTIPVIFSRD